MEFLRDLLTSAKMTSEQEMKLRRYIEVGEPVSVEDMIWIAQLEPKTVKPEPTHPYVQPDYESGVEE